MQNTIKQALRSGPPYNAETLGKMLKRARKETGVSQRAVSDRSGVSQAQLSKIERGRVNFSVETMVRLTRALELELMLVPRKYIPVVKSLIRRGPDAPPQRMYMPDWGRDDD
jgi:transcriptional regulator with XRE-family HTH domain